MAWVLVRLKWALLRGGLRTAGMQGKIGAAAALLLASGSGVIGGVVFLGARVLDAESATDATALAFAVVLFVWILGPVIAGSEGTLEPDRLALFPLSRSQLMPGLLLAAVAGFGGLTTVLLVVGAVGGMAPPTPLAVITVAAAACFLAMCAAMSRLIGTLISGAVSKRRWRDVALFAGPVIALSLNVGVQLVSRSVDDGAFQDKSSPLDGAIQAARLLPSGGPALAMGYARQGNVPAALLALLVSVLVVAAIVALWGRVLERSLTAARSSPGPASRSRTSLFPRLVPFLPRRRVGAVAAKELRLTWRDPRQRAALFGALVGAFAPALSLRLLASGSPRILLAAVAPAFMLGANAANQYGFDGASHWTNVAAGDDARADLLGKNIARALVAAPLVLLVIAGLTTRVGSLKFVPVTIGVAVAAFGVTLGLGNISSVTAPTAMPDSTTNVFSTGNSGQGMAAVGPALAILFAAMALLTPLLIPAIVADQPATLLVIAAMGSVYGGLAWWAGWSIAVRRSQFRQAELLAELTARRAG